MVEDRGSYLKGNEAVGGATRQVLHLVGQSAWEKGTTLWLLLKLCVLGISSQPTTKPIKYNHLKEEVVNYLGRSQEIKETTSWKSPLNLVTKVIGDHSNELVEVETQFQ